jgi:hypothetical protein
MGDVPDFDKADRCFNKSKESKVAELKAEIKHLQTALIAYQGLLNMKLGEKFELVVGEPLPPVLGIVCTALANAINSVPEAKNYLEFSFDDTSDRYNVRIERVK